MGSFCVIPPAKHKVVQHLVRICDTVTSDYYGAVPLSRKRCGKTREIPGFSANLVFFTRLLEINYGFKVVISVQFLMFEPPSSSVSFTLTRLTFMRVPSSVV